LPVPERSAMGNGMCFELRDRNGVARVGRTVLTLEPTPALAPLDTDLSSISASAGRRTTMAPSFVPDEVGCRAYLSIRDGTWRDGSVLPWRRPVR
jgi:hypothetical protein